jgi:hypothetical protein
MENGRAQWWVIDAAGRVTAAPTLRDLAQTLGVTTGGSMKDNNTISVERASKITGYSRSAIQRGCLANQIEHADTVSGKRIVRRMISRESVMAWADKRRKQGGNHLPRPHSKRRGRMISGGELRRRNSMIERVAAPVIPMTRLDKYLAKLAGTPLEMSVGEFIARVVKQALDKLEA